MSIEIRKYKVFPNARQYWPKATWYDADLNELDQSTAEQMFMAGAELYVTAGFPQSNDLERVVFAPMSGDVPAISLDAIDFKMLELRKRAKDIAARGRAFNRELRNMRTTY